MVSNKQKASSKAMVGSVRALKKGDTKGSNINNWLKKTGALEAVEQYKPEETGDFVTDLINDGKWLKQKQEHLKAFLQIYASVGGTSANYMVMIKELEMDLLKLKKAIEDRGKIPLEDMNYQKNFKMLQQMILDANKLNLDIGKANMDYKMKKQQKGEEVEDMFVAVE